MLSREAYEKIGAHKKIALRPDEDLQLGILVKNNGLKQRLLIGKNHIQVEWYEDFFCYDERIGKEYLCRSSLFHTHINCGHFGHDYFLHRPIFRSLGLGWMAHSSLWSVHHYDLDNIFDVYTEAL